MSAARLREDVRDGDNVLAEAGAVIDAAAGTRRSRASGAERVKVRPFVSETVEYLSADVEDNYVVAQANVRLDERGQFLDEHVEVRHRQDFRVETAEHVDYMDVSPKQIVSVATSLIPFLEHDDANRALMGSNMQRQAVPLLRPEVPLVGTGMERQAAFDSGQVVYATQRRRVSSARTPARIVVEYDDGERDEFHLAKFVRSNQGTCINQRPIVSRGQRVTRRPGACGQLLHRQGRAGAGPERALRLHELGGLQLRGRDHHLGGGVRARTSSPRSTSRSTRSRPATPSSGRKRSRATSRTWARTACVTSTRTA